MIQEKFKFYKPCKLLQPYIRYYWVFKSNRPLDAFTYPIGCPQIIFHKQAPLYIPELNVTQDKLTVSGQVNFSSHLYADGNTEMIVVVFHPHAMSMFRSGTMNILFFILKTKLLLKRVFGKETEMRTLLGTMNEEIEKMKKAVNIDYAPVTLDKSDKKVGLSFL